MNGKADGLLFFRGKENSLSPPFTSFHLLISGIVKGPEVAAEGEKGPGRRIQSSLFQDGSPQMQGAVSFCRHASWRSFSQTWESTLFLPFFFRGKDQNPASFSVSLQLKRLQFPFSGSLFTNREKDKSAFLLTGKSPRAEITFSLAGGYTSNMRRERKKHSDSAFKFRDQALLYSGNSVRFLSAFHPFPCRNRREVQRKRKNRAKKKGAAVFLSQLLYFQLVPGAGLEPAHHIDNRF